MLVHAERFGPKTAQNLVLVHGWGMDSDVLRPLAESLADTFHICLLDLPGHGKSQPYTHSEPLLDTWADALADAAPEPAAWLGWSLGGMLALRIAALRPKQVTALGLLAATPSFVTRKDWPHGVDANVLAGFQKAIATSPAKTLARFASLQVRGDEQAGQQLRELRKRLAASVPPNNQALTDGLGILETADLRKDLMDLTQAVTVLLGSHDTLMPARSATTMGQMNPNIQTKVVDGTAHLPFLSHLPATDAHFRRFFIRSLALHEKPTA